MAPSLFAEPVFVFGSNLAGRHGAGSAKAAREQHGAEPGVGEGCTGNAYAIPTKDEQLRVLPLEHIAFCVATFLRHAERHPDTTFTVVKIGCGLAGYEEADIAPMFAHAPANCELPEGWRPVDPLTAEATLFNHHHAAWCQLAAARILVRLQSESPEQATRREAGLSYELAAALARRREWIVQSRQHAKREESTC